MRKLILASVATAGLVAIGATAVSAAPVMGPVAHPAAMQTAQHGPVTNVQYGPYRHDEYHHWHHRWHHRHWEHGRWYY